MAPSGAGRCWPGSARSGRCAACSLLFLPLPITRSLAALNCALAQFNGAIASNVTIEPEIERVLGQRADLLIELQRSAEELERGDGADLVQRGDARVLVDVDLHDL